jgi:hypothetical protein
MKATRGRSHAMPLHHTEAAHHPDEQHLGHAAEAPADLRVRRARGVLLGVGAARERDHAVGRQQARSDVLSADRVADRDHERRRPAIEPAVAGVRPHRLHDVARADEGAGRRGEPVGDGGQPVLLAPMDVHDVVPGERRAQPADVCGVGGRPGTAREAVRRDASDAFGARPRDHAFLGPRATAQRDLVPSPLQLAPDAGGPVRVGGPAAAGHELEHPHARVTGGRCRSEAISRAGRARASRPASL